MQLKFTLIFVVQLLFGNGQIFIEEPKSLNIADGDAAVFTCRVDASVDVVGWLVNGTSFNQLSNPDIGSVSEQSQVGGPPNTLTIEGRSVYSGTTIQCVALFFGGDDHFSNTSLLWIQGPLASLTDLTATSSESAISLTWTPPFSLDLSYFEVDILYRVEVCKLKEGSEAYNCSSEVVGQPEYSFTEQADELFQFLVTPLSPRQDGSFLEGTRENVTGFFRGAPHPIPESVITVTVSFNPFNVALHFPQDVVNSAPGRVPNSYNIHGETVDPGSPLQLECDDTSSAEDGDNIVLQLTCRNLLPDRIYNITVEARNGVGSTNSSEITFSTHDVTRVQANNCSNAGQVNISCTFAEGADDMGYFTILYPLTTGADDVTVEYESTMDSDGTVNTTISDLPGQGYVVVVFDIESNGLPESLSAALPQRVDNVDGELSSRQGANATNDTTHSVAVMSNETRVCVSTDLDCVAIIHSTSTTDPLKMMRLLVLVLDGSGTNCTGTLPDDQYHVAVFANITQPPVYTEVVTVMAPATVTTSTVAVTSEPTATNTGVIVGVVLGIILVVGAIAGLFLLACLHKRKAKFRVFHEEECHIVPPSPSIDSAKEDRIVTDGDEVLLSNSGGAYENVPELQKKVRRSEMNRCRRLATDGEEPTPSSSDGSVPDPPRRNQRGGANIRRRIEADSDKPKEPTYAEPTVPERRRIVADGCDTDDDEPKEPMYVEPTVPKRSRVEADGCDTDEDEPQKKEHEEPKEPVYAQPIVVKAHTPHPPELDTKVGYGDIGATKNAHGITYAFTTVAPGSNVPVEDEKTHYSNIDHGVKVQVADTSFTTPVAMESKPEAARLTQEAVFEMLRVAAANWKGIGQQLKISDSLEDEIDTNNERDEDCLDQVIEFWLKNSDFQHTWAELADAVEKAGEHKLSEQIRTEKDIRGYVVFETPEHVKIQPAESNASMGALYLENTGEGMSQDSSDEHHQSSTETNPDARSEMVFSIMPKRCSSSTFIPATVVCRQSEVNALKLGYRKSLPMTLQENYGDGSTFVGSLPNELSNEQSTEPPVIDISAPFRPAIATEAIGMFPNEVIGTGVFKSFCANVMDSHELPFSSEFPTQESQQDLTAALAVSAEDNSEFLKEYTADKTRRSKQELIALDSPCRLG